MPSRVFFVLLALHVTIVGALADRPNHRKPASNDELHYWLGNMVSHHRFTLAEAAAATGLTETEVGAALKRWNIAAGAPRRAPGAPLRVLPYPGGRHPRIGFLDGAVNPQRETKFSVFTPWDEASYVVVDLPEAIWSNLGLTYLAHTHVPTLWTKQGVELPPLEWNRRADGSLDIERKMPNGISFGTRVVPGRDAVLMDLWLANGTKERLSDLRVQACVMLKGAAGFEQQTNDNKVFSGRYAACRSADGKRWVITGWDKTQRSWGNPPCPCIHADPKFPDCEPGQTQRLRGIVWFCEGTDLEGELRRVEATGWRGVRIRGEVVDADGGKPIPSRVYLRGADGSWHFPYSASPSGSAVPYRKQRPDDPASVEMHVTLSPHPFEVYVPPGRYTLTVERGPEYHPHEEIITVDSEPVDVHVKLRRWIDVAARGWYSGDTHVHRTLEELPNVMLAEDLNVALPLLHWVREAFEAPSANRPGPERDPGPRVITVDPTHVIYPRNTEYEIFTVRKKPHTLGAFFVLGHKEVFDRGVPPVRAVAEQARREGGLIELDKHNWPWSMAIVPLMKVDLYELSNNHVWRSGFAFTRFGEAPPEYMNIERSDKGITRRGWIDYGLQNYYALLNCGFRLRPTAGTASGVHPVPLGFGRVYVELPIGFSYEAWMRGLDRGRSFVTTGPMLFVKVNGYPAGEILTAAGPQTYHVTGTAASARPLTRIEIVVNGQVARTVTPANRSVLGRFESAIDEKVELGASSWLAARCYEERPGGLDRFAHSAPVHVEVSGKPLRPRRAEVEYLIRRVEEQIARSAEVLPTAALDEYREALRTYQEIARTAR